MKSFLIALFSLFVGLAAPMEDAWAKRLGGGTSSGMQRSAPASAPSSAPASQAAPAARPGSTPAATPGKRSWLGPLAGIAGAIGLAALLSHFGLGEEAASFLMMLLLVVGGFMLVRWFMGRNQKPAQRVSYAGAGPLSQPPPPPSPEVQTRQSARPDPAPNFGAAVGGGTPEPFASAPAAPVLPPDVDAAVFVRQAKLNFVRLQAANDSGDLNDIREFTTPEMYAEIKLQLDERGGGVQHTEVVELNAEILDYAEENERQILSVRFHGWLREEEEGEAQPFNEAWHLARPADRSRHWLIAGIQQLA